MNRHVSYILAAGGAAVIGAMPSSGLALSELPASCKDVSNIEFLDPKIDANGYVTADQVTYRGNSVDGEILSSADVFADCQNGNMIVVRNDGWQPFAEDVHFDRAVKAAEPYTFRDIAKIMRDNGFDAQVKKIRGGSCLCEDGFATEPRY